MRESAFMVDIATGAVANPFDTGYDESRAVPDVERMIGLALQNGLDLNGIHP
jgi:hypothetical protein